MMCRVVLVWLPCLLVLIGCLGCDNQNALVPASPFGKSGILQTSGRIPQAPPATEATALRVAELGRKIVTANPQIGVRPVFTTIGAPKPEIFHRSSQNTCEVFISEGLVKECKTEGQLAAVLCQELGKVVSEREALASPAARMPDRGVPPDIPIGNDSMGTFGAADGTRRVELARIDKERQRPSLPPPPPPPPEVLARLYLQKAGYAADDLNEAVLLLAKANQNNTLEKQMTTPASTQSIKP